MNDTSLRSIIRSLHLGNIDNVSTHTRRRHKCPVAVVLQLLTMDGKALLLLPSPMEARSPRAIERAVQIRCHYLSVVLEIAVQSGSLCPGDSGVGDEDVETPIEFLHNLVHGGFDFAVVGYVCLVGFAWIHTNVLARGLGNWICAPIRASHPSGAALLSPQPEKGINEAHVHLTPYCFPILSLSMRAFGFALYQIATFAPASANASATAKPIPAAAPVTIAVRPFREKSGRTLLTFGATVLLWVKFPPFIAPSDIFVVVWNYFRL